MYVLYPLLWEETSIASARLGPSLVYCTLALNVHTQVVPHFQKERLYWDHPLLSSLSWLPGIHRVTISCPDIHCLSLKMGMDIEVI